MCLITNDKTLYTATKNMTVYKIMSQGLDDNIAYAIHHHYKYELGKLYTTKMQESNDWTAYDSESICYLDNYCEENENWRKGNVERLLCIGKGFHAAISKSRVEDDEYYVYKCTIPKGAQYYKEPTGLIVSNQIIIVERID